MAREIKIDTGRKISQPGTRLDKLFCLTCRSAWEENKYKIGQGGSQGRGREMGCLPPAYRILEPHHVTLISLMTWWTIHHHYGPVQKKVLALHQRQSEVTRMGLGPTTVSYDACVRPKEWDWLQKPSKSLIYSWLDCHWFFYKAWLGFQTTSTGNNCFQAGALFL